MATVTAQTAEGVVDPVASAAQEKLQSDLNHMDRQLHEAKRFDPQKVRDSDTFRFKMSTLKEPRLEKNRLF